MLDHLIKSGPSFCQSALTRPRLFMLYQQNRNTEKISLGEKIEKQYFKKASKKLPWQKLRTLLTHLSFFLFCIMFDAGAGNGKIIIVVLLASRVSIRPWMLPTHPRSSLSTAITMLASALFLPGSCSTLFGSLSGKQLPLPMMRTSRTMPRDSRLPEASTPYRAGAWQATLCAQGLRAAWLVHVLKQLYQLLLLVFCHQVSHGRQF